jgi:hypothetical protein
VKPKLNLLESILKLIETMDAHPIGAAFFIRLVTVCLGSLVIAAVGALFKSLMSQLF